MGKDEGRKRRIHIDIETYSSENIKDSGVHRYTESVDFEILLVGYKIDDSEVKIIDLLSGESFEDYPDFVDAFYDPQTEKHAFNAAFERIAFKAFGMERPLNEWHCTAIRSAVAGRPLGLKAASKAFNLGSSSKLDKIGTALIRLFCAPNKKKDGTRYRVFPEDKPKEWDEFRQYCMQDVVAESAIYKLTDKIIITDFERHLYEVDQQINDRGVLCDELLALNAIAIGNRFKTEKITEMQSISNVDNPNSIQQLAAWLTEETGEKIEKLDKKEVNRLLSELAPGAASDILELRKKISKSSVKKYNSVINGLCHDGRVRGLFQFYGANRTGRWAGRRVQLQNLPKNFMKDLDEARKMIKSGNYEDIVFVYDNVSEVLSELVRTVLVAPEGKTFAVADFSAIEARVLAWLAGVKWRLEVFKTHGKIYEASASVMFGTPLDQITSELRQKGKVSELALGYGGGVNALISMMGEKRSIPDDELPGLVSFFRDSNPEIVDLWRTCNKAAIHAVSTGKEVTLKRFPGGLRFGLSGRDMYIQLPSDRRLYYANASVRINRFGSESVNYFGLNQTTGVWGRMETYGGKLVENIVQAMARDILAESISKLEATGYQICAHVHDEAIAEIEKDDGSEGNLSNFCSIMGSDVDWAPGLPLRADGYLTDYYLKKD